MKHSEIVALIGANGAGKSTLLKSILRIVPATNGTVNFSGKQIEKDTTEEIIRSGVAYVPEGPTYFSCVNRS